MPKMYMKMWHKTRILASSNTRDNDPKTQEIQGFAECVKTQHNLNFIQIQFIIISTQIHFFLQWLILGDSAFPFRIWLMKPYTHANLTLEETNFNYRLSRARMVVERAFGQLKSRWRVLYRKLECQLETVKQVTLACLILHNICIAENDSLPP